MKFAPKTEKEIAEMNLWQPGEYGFEIIEEATLGSNHYQTCDKISQSQNEMIQLVVKVYNPEGHYRIVIDYLLEKMAEKLRNAAICCGLADKYEAGNFSASDFVGKSGMLKLKIDRDKTGQYSDKNAIANYVVPDGDMNKYTPPKGHPVNDTAPIEDDEIPFTV